jgi:hypothetical protein
MCLIAYSPDGALIPRAVHDTARRDNPDGIGVMSASGVERFLGRKAGKRAWRHMRRLSERGEPFGVHYRWATHGSVMLRNTHPFRSASGVHVMHNGIIALTAPDATAEESDTALFVRDWMQRAPDPKAGEDCAGYYEHIGKLIGFGSKLLVMGESGAFRIVNEWAGLWEGGIWYSNEYSLPDYQWSPAPVCDAGAAGDVCCACWNDAAVRGDVLCAECLRVERHVGAGAEDKPREYVCRGCGVEYEEEDLWIMEPCIYCGTPREE